MKLFGKTGLGGLAYFVVNTVQTQLMTEDPGLNPTGGIFMYGFNKTLSVYTALVKIPRKSLSFPRAN